MIRKGNRHWLEQKGIGGELTTTESLQRLESKEVIKKGYDSDTGNYDVKEPKVGVEFKEKLVELHSPIKIKDGVEAQENRNDESTEKDPLFMNIGTIAKLPMASKTPTRILAADTLTTMASTTESGSQISQLRMQA